MSSTVGRNQARTTFDKVWRMMGRPVLNIVRPIEEWQLPDGVTYSRHYDQFVDASNNPVSVPWQAQPALESPFLTQRAPRDVSLRQLGQTTVHETTVVLPWSSETQAVIDHAWGVEIDAHLYRVGTWECQPAGVATPASIVVQLVEENR